MLSHFGLFLSSHLKYPQINICGFFHVHQSRSEHTYRKKFSLFIKIVRVNHLNQDHISFSCCICQNEWINLLKINTEVGNTLGEVPTIQMPPMSRSFKTLNTYARKKHTLHLQHINVTSTEIFAFSLKHRTKRLPTPFLYIKHELNLLGEMDFLHTFLIKPTWLEKSQNPQDQYTNCSHSRLEQGRKRKCLCTVIC